MEPFSLSPHFVRREHYSINFKEFLAQLLCNSIFSKFQLFIFEFVNKIFGRKIITGVLGGKQLCCVPLGERGRPQQSAAWGRGFSPQNFIYSLTNRGFLPAGLLRRILRLQAAPLVFRLLSFWTFRKSELPQKYRRLQSKSLQWSGWRHRT